MEHKIMEHKIIIDERRIIHLDISDKMNIIEFDSFVESCKKLQKTLEKSAHKDLIKIPTSETEIDSDGDGEFIPTSEIEIEEIEQTKIKDFLEQTKRVTSNPTNDNDNVDTSDLLPRNIMLELLRAYYSYPAENVERRLSEVISKYKLQNVKSKADIQKMIFKAISRYRITPDEVGLKRFPAPGDNNLKDLIKW